MMLAAVSTMLSDQPAWAGELPGLPAGDALAAEAEPPLRLAQADPTAVPPQSAAPGAGATVSPASRKESAGLFDDFSLSLGPTRFGGSLLSEARMRTATGAPRSREQLEYLNLSAASYLWQPWFAQLRGGAGVIYSNQRTQTDPAQVAASASSRAMSATGDLTVSVFPLSRFPFEGFASRSDSRTSGEVTGSDFTTTRFGFRQSYSPPVGANTYGVRYERNRLSSASFGEDTLDVVEGSIRGNLGAHGYEVVGNHSANSGARFGASSRLDRLGGRHTWNPLTNLSVESLASANRTVLRAGNTPTIVPDLKQGVYQLSSFATWRPEEGEWLYDEDRPLYVTATGRLFAIDSQSEAGGTELSTFATSLGANYTLNPQTRITGAASLSRTQTAATSDLFTSQLASIIYTPGPRPLGSMSYSWSATATAGNFTGGPDGARQSVSGQLQHSVLRSFTLSEASRLSFNGSQSLGTSYATGSESGYSVTHGVGATWFSATEAGGQTYVSLTGADARSFGSTSSSFQLVNLQATRQNLINRTSFWSGNLTIQAVRQSSEQFSTPFNVTTTGSLSYHHQRAFNVPRLRFMAMLNANSQQFESRLLGDTSAPRDVVSHSVEGRFDYTIGRLDIRLTGRTAKIDGRANNLIFLRLERRFGAI